MKGTMKFLSVAIMLIAMNVNSIQASQSSWDQEPVKALSIYPNPAVNLINIEYQASSDYQIIISNILGTVVYKSATIGQFNEGNLLRLTDLEVSSGIYLVKVYEGTVLKATKKLIVRSS